MSKRVLSVIILILILIEPTVYAYSDTSYMKTSSNKYTQSEDGRECNYEVEDISKNYKKVDESDSLTLYLDEKDLSFKVVNRKTGYTWSSGLKSVEEEKLNKQWKEFATSLLTIEYFTKNNKTKEESLNRKNANIKVETTDEGILGHVDFKKVDISFDVIIKLQGDTLYIEIPGDSVEDSKNILASIYILPFMGAVKNDHVPGYIFIPDGCGALMRFTEGKEDIEQPYIGRIYGNDEAVSETNSYDKYIKEPESIYLPVYGMVHGVGQNAYLADVVAGSEYAQIIAYPSGLTTEFNWVTSRFIYRDVYMQPTGKGGKGFVTFQKDRNRFDIELNIRFLSGEDADYIGMARVYQENLVDRGILIDDRLKKRENIPVRIEMLGGETKKGIIRNSVVPMTTVEQADYILDDLIANGAKNLLVIYKGITKGGYTGIFPSFFPFEKRLGRSREFAEFFKKYKNLGLDISMLVDYTIAYKNAPGYIPRSDTVFRISGKPIQKNGYRDLYYLSPSKALSKSKDDIEQFNKYEIGSIAIENTGNKLFANYNKRNMLTRSDSVDTYRDLLGRLKGHLDSVYLYRPNKYLLEYTDSYLDIPMYSSQYIYTTDTVPFIQMVLKGYMDYYAPYLNYSSNITEEILRMIEYGSYPSFILTYEPSYKLSDTPSKYIFTSEYESWKDIMLECYHEVDKALKYVMYSKIADREVLEEKVVKVEYENGVSIIVNYSDRDYSYEGHNVASKDYIVMGVK